MLRHVYKKGFPFFKPARAHLHSKFRKNANRSKKKFSSKIQNGYKKNQEVHSDFKSVEKVFKKCTIKSYKQKRGGNMHFLDFYSCS